MSPLEDSSDSSSEAGSREDELIPGTSETGLINDSELLGEKDLQALAGDSLQVSEEEGEELPSVVDLRAHRVEKSQQQWRSARLHVRSPTCFDGQREALLGRTCLVYGCVHLFCELPALETLNFSCQVSSCGCIYSFAWWI